MKLTGKYKLWDPHRPSRAVTAVTSPARQCWDIEAGKVESALADGT
jgi:hypothetical protein